MGTILASVFQGLFDSANEWISTLFVSLFAFCTANPLDGASWASFSWVNSVTLYIQAIALAVVLALRVASGITSGIFANGGDPTTGESTGPWLFHSLWVVALVCAMPSLMRWLVGLSCAIGGDIVGLGASSSFDTFTQDLMDSFTSALSIMSGPFGTIIRIVMVAVCVYYIGSVMLVCLARQIQMIVMSVIAPLTCITAAGQDMNSADISSICRDMLWIGVNNGLQLTLLASAMTASVSPAVIGIGPLYPIAVVAMFGAIKKVPAWIEKWTPNQVQAGQGGSRVVGAGTGMARMALIRVALRK